MEVRQMEVRQTDGSQIDRMLIGNPSRPSNGKAYQAQFTKEYPRYLDKKDIKILDRQIEVRQIEG